ncbi:MAG: transcriptional repressor [Muribaculaceae bacterium]|nr:transcriptional repressor [Muribaculaceae bacterium]MDE6131741.1 transcriptional repressor [Muribaculaceae bacterium]
MSEEINILKSRGLKETPNRILVLRQLRQAGQPMSLGELETSLVTLDKSSIFRVLNLFVEQEVAHAINGVDGITRYEVCTGHDHCSIDDMHPHFYCTSCQRHFCLQDIAMPSVGLPEGFEPTAMSVMIKGICPDCNATS